MNAIVVFLLGVFSFFNGCESNPNPSTYPYGLKSKLTFPWKENNCKLSISEWNFDVYSDAGEFVELVYLCDEEPSRSSEKHLSGFKLLVINHDQELVLMCHTDKKFKAKETMSFYFVFGSKEKHKDEPHYLNLKECQFVSENKELYNTYIPNGKNFPLGLALVWNKRSEPLNPLQLNLDSASRTYRAKKLSDSDIAKVSENLLDFYIFASSAPHTKCDVFTKILRVYTENLNSVQRDWQTSRDVPDYSINRCSKSNAPFVSNDMLLAVPSPGYENNCKEGFKFQIETKLALRNTPLAVESNDGSNVCYIENDVSEAEEIIDRYQFEALQAAASEIIVLPEEELEIEEPESIGEFDIDTQFITNPPNAKFKWPNCDIFPTSWKEKLQSIKMTTGRKLPVVDVENIILNPSVCFWYEFLLTKNTGRCKLCHALQSAGILQERENLITSLMREDGYLKTAGSDPRQSNSRMIHDHIKSDAHQISLQYFSYLDQNLKGLSLKRAMLTKGLPYHNFYKTTEALIQVVHQAVKMRLTPYNFKILTDLLEFHGVNLGVLYKNPAGMTLILKHIGNELHKKLVRHLLENEPAISISLDSSPDESGEESLSIIFQTFDKSLRQKVYFYTLIDLTTGQTGDAMCLKFWEVIKQDGLAVYLRRKLVAYVSDGCLSMTNTFNRKLQELLGHSRYIHIHCQSHRLELAGKHSLYEQDIVKQIDKVVNNLHYLLGPKSTNRKRSLIETIHERNLKKKQLGQKQERVFSLPRLLDERWVSSRKHGMRNLIMHYDTIVEALAKISKIEEKAPRHSASKSCDLNSKPAVTCKSVLQKLIDPIFLSNLAFFTDMTTIMTIFSEQLQKRGISNISSKTLRDKMVADISFLKNHKGAWLKSVTRNSKKDHIPFSTTKVHGSGKSSLKDFETSNVFIKVNDTILSRNPEFFSYGLVEKRALYIDQFTSQISTRFSNSKTERALEKFDIFDPKHFPSCGNTENYGRTKFFEINSDLGWQFAPTEVYDDYQALLSKLVCHETFVEQRKGSPEEFWSFYLATNTKDIVWTNRLKEFIMRVLAIPITSAENERIFSIMNSIKTRRRYSLKVETVESMIQILFNGENKIDKIDSFKYARSFLKEHTRSDDTHRRVAREKDDDFFLSIFEKDEE